MFTTDFHLYQQNLNLQTMFIFVQNIEVSQLAVAWLQCAVFGIPTFPECFPTLPHTSQQPAASSQQRLSRLSAVIYLDTNVTCKVSTLTLYLLHMSQCQPGHVSYQPGTRVLTYQNV